jgi:transposase
MDETIKHRIKQQYNRLSALLVFIANAFTLMYVGKMGYNDALWFGSVSGAFTYTILSTIADSQDLEDLIPERRKKPASYQVPNQPIPQNMIPYNQYQQMQQQQPQQPMAPMPAGGYINPQSGELLEAEQGPHIDKLAGKQSG